MLICCVICISWPRTQHAQKNSQGLLADSPIKRLPGVGWDIFGGVGWFVFVTLLKYTRIYFLGEALPKNYQCVLVLFYWWVADQEPYTPPTPSPTKRQFCFFGLPPKGYEEHPCQWQKSQPTPPIDLSVTIMTTYRYFLNDRIFGDDDGDDSF